MRFFQQFRHEHGLPASRWTQHQDILRCTKHFVTLGWSVEVFFIRRKNRLCQDSNLESSDSQSDALSRWATEPTQTQFVQNMFFYCNITMSNNLTGT